MTKRRTVQPVYRLPSTQSPLVSHRTNDTKPVVHTERTIEMLEAELPRQKQAERVAKMIIMSPQDFEPIQLSKLDTYSNRPKSKGINTPSAMTETLKITNALHESNKGHPVKR